MCTRIENSTAHESGSCNYNLKCNTRFSSQAVCARSGVVNKTIAMSVAKALIKRYSEMNLNHIDLDESSWAQSLLRRMKFVRRFTTTGKVPISEALRKELEKTYLQSIVRKIEENDIPLSLVLNLDQMPSKYIPVSNKTMAAKVTKNVLIKESTDKPMITATIIIALDGLLSLSMQLIYTGKPKKSLPRVQFPLASAQSTTAMKKIQLKC